MENRRTTSNGEKNSPAAWLSQTIKRLTSNYASITPDKEQTWMQELKAMAKEFGEPRTSAAVTALIRSVSDFPTVAKLRESLPPANWKNVANEDCPECEGSGWMSVRYCDCVRPYDSTSVSSELYHDRFCHACNGTGRIPLPPRTVGARLTRCHCRQVVTA